VPCRRSRAFVSDFIRTIVRQSELLRHAASSAGCPDSASAVIEGLRWIAMNAPTLARSPKLARGRRSIDCTLC
jgi:hypothetical protein